VLNIFAGWLIFQSTSAAKIVVLYRDTILMPTITSYFFCVADIIYQIYSVGHSHAADWDIVKSV
jgi:hypothetical protein